MEGAKYESRDCISVCTKHQMGATYMYIYVLYEDIYVLCMDIDVLRTDTFAQSN